MAAFRGRVLAGRGGQPTERTLATLALLATTALWGTSFVAGKAVLATVPPLTLAFLRFAVGFALLVSLARWFGVRPTWGREAAVMGATGVAFLFVFHNLGLRHTTAANGTLVMNGGYPVLAGVLGAVVLGERWRGRLLVGTVASAVGVAATVLVGGDAASIVGGDASMLGDGLILASAASAAVYAVAGRRAFAAGGPGLLAVLAGSTGYGLLLLLPGVVGEVVVSGPPRLSGQDLLLVLYLGAGCSALAYALWGFALRHLATGQTAVVGNLELVIGVGAAALLLGEPLTSGQVLGGTLILGGAWLASTGAGLGPADGGVVALEQPVLVEPTPTARAA